jgi:hypothetical protein
MDSECVKPNVKETDLNLGSCSGKVQELVDLLLPILPLITRTPCQNIKVKPIQNDGPLKVELTIL